MWYFGDWDFLGIECARQEAAVFRSFLFLVEGMDERNDALSFLNLAESFLLGRGVWSCVAEEEEKMMKKKKKKSNLLGVGFACR